MPNFNEFRMNEELLGKVLVAKKNMDFSSTEEEDLEVRKFINELEESNRTKKKSLKLRFLELITGKKLVEFKDQFGKKIIREYTPSGAEKPQLRIYLTIEREMDFGDDVNQWRNYVHEENIRDEERWIRRAENEKNHKNLVATLEQVFTKKMMKIN